MARTDKALTAAGASWRKLALWVGVAVLVVLLGLAFFWVRSHLGVQDVLTDSVTNGARVLRHRLLLLGWKGPLLIILLIGLHSILIFLPVEVPMLVALGVYGPLWGLVYTWLGSMLAAYVGFFLARGVGLPLLTRFTNPHLLENINGAVLRFGNWGLLLFRFLPIVSFNALNYACGLTRISLWNFTWTSAVGILLSDALVAFVYRGALNAAWGTVVLVVGGSTLGIAVVWQWHRRTMG